MIIALTGSIGAGKTTAARIFEKHGFTHIDADKIGHALYDESSIKGKIVAMFGEQILTGNKIDRRKLKDIVFQDSRELEKLNSFIHPLILEKIRSYAKGDAVVEGALLIESGYENYDALVVMTIDRKEQIRRLEKKGKYTREEIVNIIASQMPQEEMIKHADYVMDNSGTEKELNQMVEKLIHTFL